MERSEEYRTDRREMGGVNVDVATYRIGNRYYCHVSNADPGATIARAEGGTREEAESVAVAKASNRLGVKMK